MMPWFRQGWMDVTIYQTEGGFVPKFMKLIGVSGTQMFKQDFGSNIR